MTSTETTTATPNLRQTRKEAAAKKAPAKVAKAPAKAGGSGATNTPAKKAAAKAAPLKAAPKVAVPAARKLRWKLAEPKVDGKPVEQSAEAEGHEYRIERNGEQWCAKHVFDGKTTVLVELGGFGPCYNAAVQHNRTRA